MRKEEIGHGGVLGVATGSARCTSEPRRVDEVGEEWHREGMRNLGEVPPLFSLALTITQTEGGGVRGREKKRRACLMVQVVRNLPGFHLAEVCREGRENHARARTSREGHNSPYHSRGLLKAIGQSPPRIRRT